MGIADMLINGYNSGVALRKDRDAESRRKGLAGLYQQAYEAPVADQRQFVLQAVGIDPQAGMELQKGLQQDNSAQAHRLVGMAQALTQTPEEMRPQMYQAMLPELRRLGIPAGDQYDPSVMDAAQQILSHFDGAQGNVQSTYIDAQGNRVAIMRDGSTQVLGQNAPSNQIIDTGNGFFGVNKGNLSAAPVMIGGPPQVTTSEPIPPQDMPAFQAAVQAAQQGQDATFPVGGEQLMKAPPQVTPYQQAQLDISRQRLATSQAASARAADAASSAQSLKQQVADDKRNKVAAAQADTIATYDDSIKRIDDLLKSPEVGTLGTYMGDAQALIPHTGARNARAALDTIRNRVLLDTISKLKALSATGASGFGALSNQEGEILKNSIASLDKAQTHDAIVAALKDIQRVMRESKSRVAGVGAQAQPQNGGWKVEVVN